MRSQIAEAFYNRLTNSADAFSAGAIATEKDHISIRGAEAMKETGVSTDGQFSKQLTPEMINEADIVVLFPTDYMPDYAKNSPKVRLWNVIDPHYHQEEGMPLVRQVRDEIKAKVEQLVEESA